MRTDYVQIIERAVTLSAGSLVALGVHQATRRASQVTPEKGAKDLFRLLAPQTFKVGEILGVPNDAQIEKHAKPFVQHVKRADFEAYEQTLAESRDRSHTARAKPAAIAQAPTAPEGGQDTPTGGPPGGEPPGGTAPAAGEGASGGPPA